MEKVLDGNWLVYMIESSDGSYYTGITTDIERRFAEHCSGKRGAKYFNGRQPIKVVYIEDGHNRSSASKREIDIKRMKPEDKRKLISH